MTPGTQLLLHLAATLRGLAHRLEDWACPDAATWTPGGDYQLPPYEHLPEPIGFLAIDRGRIVSPNHPAGKRRLSVVKDGQEGA